MTLEQLRPLLAHQDTPNALVSLFALLGGEWTPAQLIAATGKPERLIYRALGRMAEEGLLLKVAGGVYRRLSKIAVFEPQAVTSDMSHVAGAGVGTATNDMSLVAVHPPEGTVTCDIPAKSSSPEKPEQDAENAETAKSDSAGKSPFLLSTNSLSLKEKEQDLKDKLLKKPGAKKIERSLMKKVSRGDLEGLLEVYNVHRGELGEVRKLTEERARKLEMLVEDYGLDGAALALEQATRHIAGDEFYQKNGYTLDNLLRGARCGRVIERAEKWQAQEKKRLEARPDPLEEYRGIRRGMELDEKLEEVLA